MCHEPLSPLAISIEPNPSQPLVHCQLSCVSFGRVVSGNIVSLGLHGDGSHRRLVHLRILKDALEEFLYQINVCHDHAPAAVTLAAQLIHGITEAQLDNSTHSHEGVRKYPSLTSSARSLT
jgi:hypothetical protein